MDEDGPFDPLVLKAIVDAHPATVERYRAGQPVTILRADGSLAVIQKGAPDRALSKRDGN